MKEFYVSLVCLLALAATNCSKKSNPLDNSKNMQWHKVAQITEVFDPIMHFVSEDVGFVAGRVTSYDTMKFKPLESPTPSPDKIIVTSNILQSTGSEPAKLPLWKTVDGGNTWKPVEGFFKTSIVDMYFVDEYTGFVLSDIEGVYKTIDGGDTWTSIFGANVTIIEPGGWSHNIPAKVCFWDENNGFVYTPNTTRRLYSFTSNGGHSWEHELLEPLGTDFIFPEKGSKVGYCKWSSLIRKTEDGGHTWKTIVDSDSPLEFAFKDATIGAYATRYKLYYTDDGGESFELSQDFVGNYDWPSFWPAKLNFSKTGDFYLIDSGKIGVSVDACSTLQHMSAPDASYWDIEFPSPTVGYALDSECTIYKYSGNE